MPPAKRKPPVAKRPPVEQKPDPKPDAYGAWERAIRALAQKTGENWRDLYEEWNERAAARTYLGNFSVEEAEALAFDDVRDAHHRPAPQEAA